jgi:hypothetical protein
MIACEGRFVRKAEAEGEKWGKGREGGEGGDGGDGGRERRSDDRSPSDINLNFVSVLRDHARYEKG